MAIKLPDFLKGGKSRVFIVVGSVMGVGFAIFIAAQFFGGGAGTVGASKVASAPTGLETVPGGKMSPEFYRAVVQANSQAAQQAKMTGGSAVPTLINVPGEQSGFPQASGDSCVVCSDEAINVVNDINNLARGGKLSRADADRLIDMTKKNVSEDEYAATLNALVRNGRLSPDQARQLLDRYKKQRQNQLLKESSAEMDGYIKADQLPLTSANLLLALQKTGVSSNDYDGELRRLNTSGKISPDIVNKLSTQYREQRAKVGIAEPTTTEVQPTNLLESMTDNLDGELKGIVDRLSPDIAKQLNALADSNVSPEQYQRVIEQLMREGKISPAEGRKLIEGYQKLSKVKDQLARLQDLKNKKIPSAQYTDELRKAVKAGLLTPQQAAALLQEYNAPATATGVGVTPGANVPGGAEFARLQQRLKTEESASPTGPSTADIQQFQAAEQEAQTSMMEEHNRRLAELAGAMSTQAQQLIASWQPQTMQHQEGTPAQEGVDGERVANNNNGPNINGTGPSSPGMAAPSGPPLIKAGTILFAVLDTGVNSDYPDSPVMATIVQGPLKGAKLLGKLSIASGKERVSLNFNLMNMDSWMNARSVNAFAIDPDTARTVLASNVDYHYLKRYGALFASSFVSGYADAIMQSGSVQTTGVFGTTSTTAALSPANKIAVGLGGIGKALSTAVAKYVDTPATVVVNSGVGLGILFMSDVSKDGPPPSVESTTTTTTQPATTTPKGSAGKPSSSAGGLPTAPTNLLRGAAGMLSALQAQPVAGIPATAATK
jgi:polyhydroxyalkanoate synthesis regulator phasin